MRQTDQQQLVIVAQPRLTDDWVTLRLEVNRNLSPNQQTWLYYGAKADERNEERLAGLGSTHAQILRRFMDRTEDYDFIDASAGVIFKESTITLQIGRAYDTGDCIDRLVDIISRLLDPRQELEKPRVLMDDSRLLDPRQELEKPRVLMDDSQLFDGMKMHRALDAISDLAGLIMALDNNGDAPEPPSGPDSPSDKPDEPKEPSGPEPDNPMPDTPDCPPTDNLDEYEPTA